MRFLLVLVCAACLAAQDAREKKDDIENPLAGKPEAIAAGKQTFSGACGACHGPGGEGGRGPNLADGSLVREASNKKLFNVIQKGVPGADMPPFPFPDEKIWQLVAYLRSLSAPAFEMNVPGDAEAGEAIFLGKGGCSDCHMLGGRGGFLGPDLSNIGRQRALRQLQQALADPNAHPVDGFRAVTVTAQSGAKISGVAKNNTNYSIQILDATGRLHLLLKKNLREVVWRKKSLMPDDYGKRLKPEETQNVLAFLSRQSMRPAEAELKQAQNSRRHE
ncbi:MAG TPA: c-type cytochrome [Bryobacterales bacterium]|nr:c-type cytochrome [Bryobacterales bacterium]